MCLLQELGWCTGVGTWERSHIAPAFTFLSAVFCPPPPSLKIFRRFWAKVFLLYISGSLKGIGAPSPTCAGSSDTHCAGPDCDHGNQIKISFKFTDHRPMWRAFTMLGTLGSVAFLYLHCQGTMLSIFPRWKSSTIYMLGQGIGGYLIQTPVCQIPACSPVDPSVSHLYSNVGDYICYGKPSFIRIRPNAVLYVDSYVLWQQHRLTPEQIS